MKLLIKDSDKNLVWREAEYKGRCFCSTVSQYTYGNNDIYAIKDDNRNKLVICSACGAKVLNTPSAINAHRNMVHKSDKCFDCRNLRHQDEKVLSTKYVLNEDGTYSETTKRNVRLFCRLSGWNSYDINSDEAKQRCRYAACENANFNGIEDFWTKYPDAFNEFVTVDRIIDTGYQSMGKYRDYIKYELKCVATLYAIVNNQGICTEFQLGYRRNKYTIRYSKKYDKVWIAEYGDFSELSMLELSEKTEKSIMEKLRTLYK